LDAYEKTKDLLHGYNYFLASRNPTLLRLAEEIDHAMAAISKDPYYEIIVMYYFYGESRENIAETLRTSVTTVSRNKRRLVGILSKILFSGGYIEKLYAEYRRA
jgi:DNA-directed RNA polymerase specialized sigma24 family protein